MYLPSPDRYQAMPYRRTGRSGLLLPALSLGLWHNFGSDRTADTQGQILRRAFDLGVTHFDLANNYGPPPGAAESAMGRALKTDFARLRDEIVISTKAGYLMWDGPYGEWGSRKSVLSSLDRSLTRLGLDYVDIFYSHRPDPDTPLEETMGALDSAVRQGKALYVGLSNYSPEQTREAARILKDLGTPLLIHQPRYSMLDRWVEDGLLTALDELGVGSIAYSPLEQGILSDRYLQGIPVSSRAAGDSPFLTPESVTPELINAAARAGQGRLRARAVPGADGAGLGAAGRTGHVGRGRGEQCRSVGEQRRRGAAPGVQRRGTGPDRGTSQDPLRELLPFGGGDGPGSPPGNGAVRRAA